ncbi:sortase A [Alkalibacillus filiformis]|uniref:Sortase A n=1 Tax=Alkalibacillus filiformis TaxID=200990 RepID=A0ABU0DW43_9BACI|nr:class D sortase [Alkalibacillus filiformis]MDQ0352375.1 sortase A [Alkalibacillus filiformis]
MLKKLGYLIICIGILVISYTGWLLYDFYNGSQYQLEEAEQFISQHVEATTNQADKSSRIYTTTRGEFELTVGEVFATIEIPAIDLELPIIEGSELEHLKHGVGHDPRTWLPSDGDQIFLTGHNDSAFLDIGDLVEGDRIIINVPYGTYEYEIDFYEVGHETETDRIGSMGEETLVLMTCYPFFSLTTPDERYFVYANPVE